MTGSSPLDPLRDVLIVTVQYRNFSDTEALVTSLARAEETAFLELIVVDNDATAASSTGLDALPAFSPFPIHVVRPSQNLFYWGGAAFALKMFCGPNGPRPKWVIICNNDVIIRDPFFFPRLRSLDGLRYPIIAPSIVSLATHRDQNPFLRAPLGMLERLKFRVYDTDYRIATTMLAAHGAWKKLRQRFQRSGDESREQTFGQRIYAPHGALVIFSAAFFNRGGVLDTTVPMYAEELTIAALAEHLEIPVWYLPELQVFHREHAATGHRLTRDKYEFERLARRHYHGLGDPNFLRAESDLAAFPPS